MIYLDNAATGLLRPASVSEHVLWAMEHAGNPGRSGHEAAYLADEILTRTRQDLTSLLDIPDESRTVFTHNTTDALNMALFGYLPPHCHVVTTMLEHNSVLRPLYALEKERGISVTFVPPEKDGAVSVHAIERALKKDTALIAMTHVSNVTGCIQPVEEIGMLAKRMGIPLLIDGAQAAGHLPVSVLEIGASFYAVPGHKGLMGPLGTGALYTGLDIRPRNLGGSGVLSFETDMPKDYPEHMEAGTQNVHGIHGLDAGIAFIRETTSEAIHEKEKGLAHLLLEGLASFPDVMIYSPASETLRSGVIAFNLGSRDSSEIGSFLAKRGICVRAGFHCAPLIHKLMGTEHRGAVRVSFSYFNTEDDVAALLDALKELT